MFYFPYIIDDDFTLHITLLVLILIKASVKSQASVSCYDCGCF